MPSQTTYMPIPPPPLPEFYLSKKTNKSPASSDCSSSDLAHDTTGTQQAASPSHQASRDGAVKRRVKYTRSTAGPANARPLSSPTSRNNNVPPLAVYHICRICYRPRSSRYHREHPIPINGVPPPPGICRRCRVTPVDEVATIKVVNEQESNDIKLGLKCLLPDEDYVSNNDMRKKRAKHILSTAEWEEVEPEVRKEARRTEIVHRHIHVDMPQPPPAPANIQPRFAMSPSRGIPVHEFGLKGVDVQSASPDVRRSAESKKASMPQQIRVPAETWRPEFTETQIRDLAREEIERYRNAERKIESHRQPYAHGGLVPIEPSREERRIKWDREQDAKRPWEAQNHSSRKDSAFAVDIPAAVVQDKTTPNMLRSRAPIVTSSSSLPSEDSDKTRGLAPDGEQRSWISREDVHSQRPATASADSRNYHVMKNVEHGKASAKQKASFKPADSFAKTVEISRDESTNHSTSRLASQKVQEQQQDTTLSDQDTKASAQGRSMCQSDQPVSAAAGESAHDSRRIVVRSVASPDLPYPCDGQSTSASMPSPRSHRSTSVKHDASDQPRCPDRDDEYYYAERTVRPAKLRSTRPSYSVGEKSYYRETEEHLQQRRVSAQPAKAGHEVVPPPAIPNQAASVASSRVRFYKKVEISPTPPGSDASSSEFRHFYKAGWQLDGRELKIDKALAGDYEHRGRSRNREPSARRHYYKYGTVRAQDVQSNRAGQEDRDQTPRPSQRERRSSDESAASTVPTDIKTWARVRSESPSREVLLEEVKRGQGKRVDGAGPYTDGRRSDSVDAEDGSTPSPVRESYRDVRYRKDNRGDQRRKV